MLTFMRKNAGKIIIWTLILFVLSIGVIALQSNFRGDRPKQSELKVKGQLATINNEEININYFIRSVNSSLLQYRSGVQKDPTDPKIVSYIQYQALMQTLQFEKYLLIADKYKIKPGWREVPKQIEAVRKSYNLKDNKELEELLEKNNYSYKDFKKDIENEIKVNKLLAYTKSNVAEVTDEDILNQFKKVGVSHILIASGPDEDSKKLARERIQEIYDKVVSGENFAVLAEQFSEDPVSKVKGGDLGEISSGMTVPEFEKEAFALNEGEHSKPFETPYGFHILKVSKITQEEVPIDVDEEELKKEIMERRVQDALGKLRFEADRDYQVEIFLPVLKAFDLKSRGKLEEALNTYQLLVAENPASPIPHLFTAEIYEIMDKSEEALKEYKTALLKEKMNPATKNPFTHYYLGEYYRSMGDKTNAAKEYKLVEEMLTDNLRMLQRLQDSYEEMGYTKSAGRIKLKIHAIENARKLAAEERADALNIDAEATENVGIELDVAPDN